ncbi:MAG: tetratricopeptide repeat protein [Mediterranea massiliensis]|nr:tetratricopeptide repeat protein [Mediterranea massiliensis]
MKTLPYILLLSAFLFIGCQSIEPFSIDYLQPGKVNFPASLRKVAIVNNTPVTLTGSNSENDSIALQTNNASSPDKSIYQGDAQLTTEALAQAIADEYYFDEVIICDSALRTNDSIARTSNLLSIEEVKALTQAMHVDFLIAVEGVEIHTQRQINYLAQLQAYYGTLDAIVRPTIRIYLPNRSRPLISLLGNDSIFWEEASISEASVHAQLPTPAETISQASEFAGTIPIQHLLPTWKSEQRYLFTGGNVAMRDAAVYAREGNWTEAIALWNEQYKTKKGKQKMRAAFNMAVGYEMQDSIESAYKMSLEAQKLASETENTLYVPITLYVNELQQRKEGLLQLNAQMQRFEEDF